jgi:L-arabinose isomerase
MAEDRTRFRCELPRECHERSVRVGLGLRRVIERNGGNAFSMNFLAFDSADGPVNTVPFLEASKAMARGVGYAGEGDVLTAALVGALASAFGRTTFTEIFCPDWRGNSLFLSHMGEICPDVLAGRPRVSEKPYKFSAALNPAVLTGRMQPGPAVFVNLVPGPSDTFSLIAAPVEVLADSARKAMDGVVRGWIRPPCSLPAFLEAYSRHGGTHHSALVLGERTEAVLAFARFAGLDGLRIGSVASR